MQPRRGAAPIEASRVGRGALLGHNTLVRDGAYGAPTPRLHSAHCGSRDGCKILSISKELFSHLTDGKSTPPPHRPIGPPAHHPTTPTRPKHPKHPTTPPLHYPTTPSSSPPHCPTTPPPPAHHPTIPPPHQPTTPSPPYHTQVFGPLGEELSRSAEMDVEETLNAWHTACPQRTELMVIG